MSADGRAGPRPDRVYIAVRPPDEAIRRVTDAWAQCADERLRATTPERWHVTLAFLGDVPAPDVDRLVAPLARIASTTGDPLIRLSAAGRFDDRVLWLGVGPDDALAGLAARVRQAVAAAGLTLPYGDTFVPHWTLARAHRTTVTPAHVAALTTAVAMLGGPYPGSSLLLARSRDRGVHEVVGCWPFPHTAGGDTPPS